MAFKWGILGLGNIAGVGVAMAIGGPGAAFWMIIAGILAMAVKFSSTTLSMRYREYDTKGVSYGGPMYYLQKGMEEKGWKMFAFRSFSQKDNTKTIKRVLLQGILYFILMNHSIEP